MINLLDIHIICGHFVATQGHSWPPKSKLSQTNHVTTQKTTRGAEFRWRQFWKSLSRGSGHFGPFRCASEFCSSWGCFDWSHDQSMAIVNSGPKMAQCTVVRQSGLQFKGDIVQILARRSPMSGKYVYFNIWVQEVIKTKIKTCFCVFYNI